MKALISTALMLLSPCPAAAQSAPSRIGPPGIAVVESSWKRVVQRVPDLEDPLSTLEAQDRAERVRNQVIQENRERAATGMPEAPVPSRTVRPPRQHGPRGPKPEYVYEVKVSNTGAKKIRELVWKYVLLDPDTGREISDHQFTSKVSIRPGRSKKLVGHSAPPALVSVARTNRDLRDQYTERVEIRRVEYDDGSVWESTSK
jgi:hypothetical protein